MIKLGNLEPVTVIDDFLIAFVIFFLSKHILFLYLTLIFIMSFFLRKQEYGLTLLMSTDAEVNKYLDSVLTQIKDWLEQRKVSLNYKIRKILKNSK